MCGEVHRVNQSNTKNRRNAKKPKTSHENLKRTSLNYTPFV